MAAGPYENADVSSHSPAAPCPAKLRVPAGVQQVLVSDVDLARRQRNRDAPAEAP